MRGRRIAIVVCMVVASLAAALFVPVEHDVQLERPLTAAELRTVDDAHTREIASRPEGERAYWTWHFEHTRPYWTGAFVRKRGLRVRPAWALIPWNRQMVSVPHFAERRAQWCGDFVVWRIVIAEQLIIFLFGGALLALVAWLDRRGQTLLAFLSALLSRPLGGALTRDVFATIATADGLCCLYAGFSAAGAGGIALLWDALNVHAPSLPFLALPAHWFAVISATMAVTAVLLGLACRTGLNHSNHAGRQGRLALLLGTCASAGPIGVLCVLGLHGAPKTSLLFNGVGALGLIVINGVPLLFYRTFARGVQRLDARGPAPAAPAAPGA